MKVTESVPLASITTLKVGGVAKIVATCNDIEDIKAAIMLAHDRGLSWYVVGGGSNLLASDSGYDGVVIHLAAHGDTSDVSFEQDGDSVIAVAPAMTGWDSFVEACTVRNLWGIENLAGIPGTVGAAPVQNIGAYGAEVADTLSWVDVLDTASLEVRRMQNDECAFGYRDSIFKHDRSLIIIRVAFSLSVMSAPKISYADIAVRIQDGAHASTSEDIAVLVRSIRAGKFPDLTVCGTAGSFFKNPLVSDDEYVVLKEKFPELPGYESEQGIKVSLAWILDKALNLKGFSHGPVRLFEKQPLVLVTEASATSCDVDSFANLIAEKVFTATNIRIEREVQNLLSKENNLN